MKNSSEVIRYGIGNSNYLEEGLKPIRRQWTGRQACNAQVRAHHRCRNLLALAARLALALLPLLPITVQARPRPPLPPAPEARLCNFNFDQAHDQFGLYSAPSTVDGTDLVESFSGYALRREGLAVTPFLMPVLREDGKPNFNLDQGAIRFWFRPNFTSAGPVGGLSGSHPRLLELTCGPGQPAQVWWALYLDPTGSTVYLTGQTQQGPTDLLQANVQWNAGEWHLLALTYTPTNTALVIDGVVAAVGSPFLSLPVQNRPSAAVALGSTITGDAPAQGQFDEVAGLGPAWNSTDFGNYYATVASIAAQGPITEAEDQARYQAGQARRATLVATSALAPELNLMTPLGQESLYIPFYGGTNGFWLSPPVVDGTNISLTLWNADTNKSYDIYFVSALRTSHTVWQSIAANGQQGQTNFTTTTMLGDIGFFRAFEGNDWDNDGYPNYRDAQPYNGAVSNLTVTIQFPAHGSNVN